MIRPIFSLEKAEDCFEEAMPLLQKHWEEIAHYKDIPLDPDFETYKNLEVLGFLRCYTARVEGKLVGYAVFIVKGALHYKTSKQAMQDILFIDPEYRGFGARFILWCDMKLKQEKVIIVHHHVKQKHNFGTLLEKMKYECVDLIFSKRLDK